VKREQKKEGKERGNKPSGKGPIGRVSMCSPLYLQQVLLIAIRVFDRNIIHQVIPAATARAGRREVSRGKEEIDAHKSTIACNTKAAKRWAEIVEIWSNLSMRVQPAPF